MGVTRGHLSYTIEYKSTHSSSGMVPHIMNGAMNTFGSGLSKNIGVQQDRQFSSHSWQINYYSFFLENPPCGRHWISWSVRILVPYRSPQRSNPMVWHDFESFLLLLLFLSILASLLVFSPLRSKHAMNYRGQERLFRQYRQFSKQRENLVCRCKNILHDISPNFQAIKQIILM